MVFGFGLGFFGQCYAGGGTQLSRGSESQICLVRGLFIITTLAHTSEASVGIVGTAKAQVPTGDDRNVRQEVQTAEVSSFQVCQGYNKQLR